MKILSIIIFLTICLILPIASSILICKKYKANLNAVLIGALIFIFFQLLTRIPLLNYLYTQSWFLNFTVTNPLIYGFFLATTAGLFEEIGRFIAFKFFFKNNNLTLNNGITYGIGHGGIEAILIVAIPVILTGFVGEWNEILLSSIERLLAITLHIGLSLYVLYSVKHKKHAYLLLAIIIHTVVNLGIFILPNPIIFYIYFVVITLITFIYILKKFEKEECIKNEI